VAALGQEIAELLGRPRQGVGPRDPAGAEAETLGLAAKKDQKSTSA
jgi:hypothetical protein